MKEKKPVNMNKKKTGCEAAAAPRQLASDALRESELRFKAQYQGIPVPTFTWQKQGEDFKLIDFNEAAKVITHEKVIEFVGRKASDLYANRQEILRNLQQCFVQRKVIRRETLSEHFLPGKLITVTFVFIPSDLVMVHMEDISERKQAESEKEAALEALRDSLVGKEVLLKEVHHRVKNNLTAIVGLLQLQRETVTDPVAVALFCELEGRIRSMALVHEKLYHFESLNRIDLQDYIEKLIAELRTALVHRGNVRFSVAATGVTLGLDNAVPCGLILNELITNALKYAFPGDQPRTGEKGCAINIAAKWDSNAGDDGVYTLTVADNGVGLPVNLDWATTKTLGLRLVRMLGQFQLKGRIELDRSQGTSFRFVFASRPGEKEC
jgi:two-component sensor histidine kinase